MINLVHVQNVFTKNNYPPNENNVSLVPFADIQSFLVQEFGETGYSVKVTHAGNAGNKNFVIVQLEFKLENGSIVNVPGAADGNTGMAGLLSMAVRNAVLRHLGAGTELYEHEEGEEPTFQDSTPPSNVVQNPFSNAKTYGSQYQAPSKGNYGPWDGTAKLKTGKNAGKMWKELSNETIDFLASNGNNLAEKELARRVNA